jgi:hypothetical protein
VFKTNAAGKLSATKAYPVGISIAGPFGIALAAVGPECSSTELTAGSIRCPPSSCSRVDELVGDCPTGMGYPTGMMADPSGHFFCVVNRNSSAVTQFTIAKTNGVALFPAVRSSQRTRSTRRAIRSTSR